LIGGVIHRVCTCVLGPPDALVDHFQGDPLVDLAELRGQITVRAPPWYLAATIHIYSPTRRFQEIWP
jgi:hypothetical protein